ncbi:hypothetical protein SAMN05216198_3286 [Halopseudomonas litoralis]|uniref:DUF4124 domain-containing protein n=1 Tax=Halopseudomonas litoralis TaxID=797277 RepID=A0A1H1WJU4_9GAMM|nr:DUF4124 domain-containing protein [Halopseudomonas litoralis]SDS96871.1 hypothetical protein SAMN05216198_3286 [Halopseudomonas litoralis]
MQRRIRYQAVAALLGAVAVGAEAADLYRYVNDKGITVLDKSVPPHYVSRGYEVLDADGRVKLVVPAAPTREEREAARAAEQEQQRRATADGTLLRLYSGVKDLDRAHDRQIQQIENLIATTEAGLLTLQAQRDDLQSRAAAQERAGRKVDPQILRDLAEVEAEQGRLQRLITSNRGEVDAVNQAFASRRQRLQQLLAD